MRKRLFLLLFSLFILFSFCGCSSTTSASNQQQQMFDVVESYGSYGSVLVDTDTGVMYYRSNESNSRGQLTLLVDAAGNPKLYHRE